MLSPDAVAQRQQPRQPASREIEFIPASYVARLELDQMFGRSAPLVVDLGCGDGSFLAAAAREHPERNFLGIERMLGRVRKTAHKARDLTNVRVLRLEVLYAVRYLLPENSVHAFHLLFPDPWPKRRHQRRRVVNPDFLQAIVQALAPDGTLRVVTDQEDYFQQIDALAKESADLAPIHDVRDAHPTTAFERKFLAAGAPIYRLALRKVSPVR